MAPSDCPNPTLPDTAAAAGVMPAVVLFGGALVALLLVALVTVFGAATKANTRALKAEKVREQTWTFNK